MNIHLHVHISAANKLFLKGKSLLPEELMTSFTIIKHIAPYCQFRHTMRDKLGDLDADFLPRRSAIMLIMKNGGLNHNCSFSVAPNRLIHHGHF